MSSNINQSTTINKIEKISRNIFTIFFKEESYFKLKNKVKLFLIKKNTPIKDLKIFLKTLHPYKTNIELIRIGDKNKDGGYLVPNDLRNIEAIFSPGVSTNWSFEEECIKKGIKKAYLADGSVNPKIKNENIHFIKKFIGSKKSSDFITLENWIKTSKIKENSDLMLQMDIEGWEYDVIKSTSSETLNKFRIILVEFHNFEFLLNKEFFLKVKKVFEKLLQTHYIVHIHPNNVGYPINYKEITINPLLEFTFLRKDRVTFKEYQTTFPHPLDIKNMKDRKDVRLSKDFYYSNK